MCALQMKMSWLYFGVKPVWPSSLFSTPLFLLEGQVLLFVSVYDLFITSRCQKQHRCNVSCDGNVLNSGSKPARSSSFPPTRLHSVPALDFPDKSTLLYLMSSKYTFYYSPTLQLWLWHVCTSFKRFSNPKDRECQTQHVTNGGQSVTCRTFSRFPTLHLRGAQHYYCWPSSNPPHFSMSGSLF